MTLRSLVELKSQLRGHYYNIKDSLGNCVRNKFSEEIETVLILCYSLLCFKTHVFIISSNTNQANFNDYGCIRSYIDG